MNRESISLKYLEGTGLEIAGLHNPWPLVHRNNRSIQMDLFSTEHLYAQYPEHKNDKLVTVQILDDGNYCKSIATDSMDFVVSSHVLEHCVNVIEAIRNWLRVVKKGKYVCMAVPDKNNWIDKDRELTTYSHFLTEFRDPFYIETVMTEAHYREYFHIVDKLSGKALDDRVWGAMRENPRPHIHWHTFTAQSFAGLLMSMQDWGGFTVVDYAAAGHEMLAVLQKTVSGDLNWSGK